MIQTITGSRVNDETRGDKVSLVHTGAAVARKRERERELLRRRDNSVGKK